MHQTAPPQPSTPVGQTKEGNGASSSASRCCPTGLKFPLFGITAMNVYCPFLSPSLAYYHGKIVFYIIQMNTCVNSVLGDSIAVFSHNDRYLLDVGRITVHGVTCVSLRSRQAGDISHTRVMTLDGRVSAELITIHPGEISATRAEMKQTAITLADPISYISIRTRSLKVSELHVNQRLSLSNHRNSPRI